MRKYLSKIVFVSVLVAIVSYFVKVNQEGVSQEDVYWNVIGAFFGMFAGMFIYYRFMHEEKNDE